MSDELDILRKLHFGSVTEDELMDIFHRYRDNYRIQMHLAMHPKFPDKFALNIISRLHAMDLIRVIKNIRTNPFTRKKAEMEFQQKYSKFPIGEKLSYMKIAPYSLMVLLIEEKDKRVVDAMLNNPYCTEDLVVRFINRYSSRSIVYEALFETEWYKRPAVAEAIAHDPEAPIRILLLILPFLNRRSLKKLYE
ncbi:MAG TPA: hypothetical protein VK186_09645, partial [Candidatus Deferrimicrobium sp.]|nr:hypothetical protein [Candidatus Deferrimicrobium sp.]